MAKASCQIPLSSIERIQIYINKSVKTLAQIKQETGADYIINGGLFQGTNAVCHLKADGTVYAKDKYTYWGYAWDDTDIAMTVIPNANKKNYICCTELIRNKEPQKLLYTTEMGGKRGRTAMGLKGGNLCLYASSDGADAKTPEALQAELVSLGWESAIMLDGGGSSQCDMAGIKVTSSRKVHNLILIYTKTKESDSPMSNFKIALGAGHGASTPGKRCDKALDPNETAEWWLNDRIADMVESQLKDYTGYSLLRLDDSDDGKEDVALKTRVNKANAWGADFYLSIHHNAGANLTNAGGIVAFSCPGSTKGAAWRDAFYNELIAATGLKGNRYDGTLTANFYVIKYTDAPAVLLELGFMDSKIDVPIILSKSFAQKCATAITKVLVERGGLKKKASTTGTLYKVQLGAFSVEANAKKLEAELESRGYEAFIVRKDGYYKVQTGAFSVKANAEKLEKELEAKGYQAYVTKA